MSLVLTALDSGVYNAIARNIEPELTPVLRKHGLALYIFNPLGGGFFAGSFSKDGPVEKGSRVCCDCLPLLPEIATR
jgi:aflatoxin B1 aldehyde reductase